MQYVLIAFLASVLGGGLGLDSSSDPSAAVSAGGLAVVRVPFWSDAGFGVWPEGEVGDLPSTPLVTPMQCPDWTTQSQPPDPPPFFYAATSDIAGGFYVFEDYSVPTPVCGVHFWGFTVVDGGGPVPCTEDPMTFEVRFYDDVGGAPGSVVQTNIVTLSPTPTGVFYAVSGNTLELLAYDAVIDPCCAQTTGWMAVLGASTILNDCWFAWMSQLTGATGAIQHYPSGSVHSIPDRACCLREAPSGACCTMDDPYCQILDEGTCVAEGGVYVGDASACSALDCNFNGRMDVCDVALGLSEDLDQDGVPDECGGELMLMPGGGTHYAVGDQIVVEAEMWSVPGEITGAQLFLEYDPGQLAFVSADPADFQGDDPQNPFEIEVYEIVDPQAGSVDYAVGVPAGVPGALGDLPVAHLVFEALTENCASEGLLAFRPTMPPTRLTTVVATGVYPRLMDLPVLSIDGTAPVIETCPAPVTVQFDLGEHPHLPDRRAELTASDNCSSVLVVEQQPAPGARVGYGLHDVTFEVFDEAGLSTTCDSTVLVEGIGTPRLVVECDQDCYAAGDAMTVDVWMVNIPDTITGGQFFVDYDDSLLALVTAPAGTGVVPGDAPFSEQLYECSVDEPNAPTCTPTVGLVDYAVGMPAGAPGVAGTVRLATLHFTALGEIIGVDDVITFRTHDPPTRLVDEIAGAVYPVLVDLDIYDDDTDGDGVVDCRDLCPDTPPGTPVTTTGCPDCNGNNLDDACDLSCGSAGGYCDVPGCGQSGDCNANSLPDECDLGAGTSLDCNATGVPDECETLSAGDFNSDGVVDLGDFPGLSACLAGPGEAPAPPEPACQPACLATFDVEQDGDVDLGDLAAWLTSWSAL